MLFYIAFSIITILALKTKTEKRFWSFSDY